MIMNQIKKLGILICLLIFFVFFTGCLQGNTVVSGEYLSERNFGENNESIIFNNSNFLFNEGNFTHVNYNNSFDAVKFGTFKNNNNLLTLNYPDGIIIEYTVTPSGQVLIPVNENISLSEDEKLNDRFYKKLYYQ